jgi:hypothetical protein|tara:strand:- start:32 stop:922 length:891 start_codon:yes stop_codon:yes gene_type:complete
MGYLNNSSRTLDAILTKKGREILSSGGDFEVTKFALGDDEIDYALWDTTHTQGTDYYGAVIDNLPALEPFNDPSEIMKYKLVKRSLGTEAMCNLIDTGGTQTGLNAMAWNSAAGTGGPVGPNRIYVKPVPGENYVGSWPKLENTIGGGTNHYKTIAIGHTPNAAQGNIDLGMLMDESYTVTVLDSSVAVLAPTFIDNSGTSGPDKFLQAEGSPSSGMQGHDSTWVPFINNVQHVSQTIKGLVLNNATLAFTASGTVPMRNLQLYSKKIPAASTTSVIVTGDKSGAVIEFDVSISYS